MKLDAPATGPASWLPEEEPDAPGVLRGGHPRPASATDELVERLRRQLWVERAVFGGILALLGAFWLYRAAFPSAWAIYVADRPVAALASRDAAQQALDQVRGAAGSGPGVSFSQPVRLGRIHPSRTRLVDVRAAAALLGKSVSLQAVRGVIYVDGTAAVALPTEAEANATLERVKSALAGADQLEAAPRFKEKVEVRTEAAPQDLWADGDTAFGLLKGEGGEVQGSHTVTRGESAWSIARRHRISVDDLRALNPGVNLARLQIGQELSVGEDSGPLVSVLSEGRISRVLPTSYRTEVRKSPQLFVGKRIQLQAGKPGKQRITYRVRMENGQVVHRDVISQETLVPARTKIVVHGARPRR